MKEPTFDADGYPTDETCQQIRNWEAIKPKQALELLDFLKRAWTYPNYFRSGKQKDKLTGSPERVFRISTGGWSGNESLMSALQDNMVFWGLYWSYSKRGGHYEFRIPI